MFYKGLKNLSRLAILKAIEGAFARRIRESGSFRAGNNF